MDKILQDIFFIKNRTEKDEEGEDVLTTQLTPLPENNIDSKGIDPISDRHEESKEQPKSNSGSGESIFGNAEGTGEQVEGHDFDTNHVLHTDMSNNNLLVPDKVIDKQGNSSMPTAIKQRNLLTLNLHQFLDQMKKKIFPSIVR